MKNYSLMHVETALCVWEYLLEIMGESKPNAHRIVLETFIEKQGTSATRIELIGSPLIEQLDKQYQKHQHKLGGYSFDWEVVPAFVGFFIEKTELLHGFDLNDEMSDCIIEHVLNTLEG